MHRIHHFLLRVSIIHCIKAARALPVACPRIRIILLLGQAYLLLTFDA